MSKPEKQHFQRGYPEADHMLRAFAKHGRVINPFHIPYNPSGPDDEEVSTDGSHQFLQADRTVVGVPTPLDFED
tara:strand:+ start:168 stop:389 length:222 start_codon:yes stop_codon:yes gene_type:complete